MLEGCAQQEDAKSASIKTGAAHLLFGGFKGVEETNVKLTGREQPQRTLPLEPD